MAVIRPNSVIGDVFLISILEDCHRLGVPPRCGYSSFSTAFSVRLNKCLRDALLSCIDVYLFCACSCHISYCASISHGISLALRLGQCGLWYPVRCQVGWCIISVFIL